MNVTLKRWTGLGLGAALATTTLAACSPTDDPAGVADTPPVSTEQPAPTATLGEGEGIAGEGEGGEGEGGVAFGAAATDPVVFLSALAITEAHIIAARDAFNAGETDAAAEMFAHPVSEVLFDMEPAFQVLGVEDFTDLLSDASRAVITGQDAAEIESRSDAIVAALRDAATKAPASDQSDAEIAAKVVADQIDRAADMYRIAKDSPRYEPYLDGYGFYKAANAMFEANRTAIDAGFPDAAVDITLTLDLLAEAYPTATRPETLDANESKLLASASSVMLSLPE